jgi:ATP-dependent helicase HrpB
MGPDLPIESSIPELVAALAAGPNAVLQAPPGAGKTTRAPLALLGEPWARGRIVMLQPRRIAARAAAARMAQTLGEAVGDRVGFRIRGARAISAATRIEVVTEGILTRMVQADPGLAGVSAVIFDEVHERSLNTDLGLALCLEAQAALRPDLRLLAMSATLDAAPFAALMGGAPVITATGRAFGVETRWLDAPPGAGRLEDATAAAILRGIEAASGDVLAFLPGVGEIARTAALLAGRLPSGVEVRPLHGDLPFPAQQAALAPATPGRRRVVLATAIAETSLTVDGVRIVVDAGRARRARFDPGSGMTRLVTERVSRAEADQRRGRAGRTAPGLCLRLWTRGEEGGFAPFAPPEIRTADLTGLALELAAWGARGAGDLAFLDPPPAAALAEARALLASLGALGGDGAITATGRAMVAMPLHPRLSHMILSATPEEAATACALAALLTERDLLRFPGAPSTSEIGQRLEALADPARFRRVRGRPIHEGALARAAETARLLAAGRPRGRIDPAHAGGLLARAYPDRIAGRRPGDAARYLLSGGKGAWLAPDDPLASAPFLVAADTDGDPREARIRLAAPIAIGEIEAIFAEAIVTRRVCRWSARTRSVEARRERVLGTLTLDAAPLGDAAPGEIAAAMAEGVRALGLAALPWSDAARRLRARVLWLRDRGATDLPDWSDAGLLAAVHDWLAPHLGGFRRAGDLARLDLHAILRDALGWAGLQRVEREAPGVFTAPSGVSRPIDYDGDQPKVALRPRDVYGLDAHPVVAGVPLLLEMRSPADRPIAATADLPGFWRGAWADVRKEMRGRYPRHDWPEHPHTATPARLRRG